MNIPLINSNSKQDINTSLIAIRNAINELARVKESESVEDLQRQINIINQQIANFNSEFSAINTHLNTIDTNILNLQPVDTVASGNLHSVTSNAVANMNNIASPIFIFVDVFTTAESCLVNKTSFFRIYEASANHPLGSGSNDFYYYVTKVETSLWIRVLAFDVRSNNIFAICKRDGYWQSWQEITDNVVTSGTATLDPNYVTRGTIRWVKRGKFCTLNFENVVFQNISGYSDTPFATGIPRPLYGYGSYGVLQYGSAEGHSFVNIANVNNDGVIRPDAYLNVNADTYGAIVYMTAD
jgi:hypothetical protein